MLFEPPKQPIYMMGNFTCYSVCVCVFKIGELFKIKDLRNNYELKVAIQIMEI